MIDTVHLDVKSNSIFSGVGLLNILWVLLLMVRVRGGGLDLDGIVEIIVDIYIY